MDESLKRYIKSAMESFNQKGSNGGTFEFNYTENRIDKVENGGIGVQKNYYDCHGKKVDQEGDEDGGKDADKDADKDEPPALYSKDNRIFDPKKFTTEAKFKEAHDTILKVITNHGPLAQSEWYYVMKAIKEAKVSVKAGFQVTEFIAQMIIWYPEFFSMKANESEREMIHRYMQSISHESQKWLVGPDNHEVAIVDMLCQRSLFHYKYDWTKRVHDIASELKTALQSI